MSVILKIAFRNLREHKIKTLIIGMIIAIGIAVLVVGNSLMDTATAGIKKNYTENYTGHIIITGEHRSGLSLFGMDSMDESIPVIPDYEKVLEYVAAMPQVAEYSPQAYAQATVSVNDETRGFAMLFGINPTQYQRIFPDNIELVSGEFLQPGAEGLLLSERAVKQMTDDEHPAIKVGDSVLLTGISLTGGTHIRSVPVRGIFRFTNSNPQLNMVSLIDITNLRALAGMNALSEAELFLAEEEEALLGEVDEESIFGGESDLFGEGLVGEGASAVQMLKEDDLLNIFGDDDSAGDTGTSEIAAAAETGDWHFLLLRLKNQDRTEQVRATLERFFADEGIAATTQGWVEGAGVMAKMTTGIKTVFNIIVLIVAVVAVIIIMNTLVISVTERIPEIGTMRAVGAQKSFVRLMITWETVIISGFFGLIGLLAGALILLVLNLTGIEAPNIFFRILFGGDVLRPVLSLGSVGMSIAVVTVIGVVASLYPVSIALKIQPVRAMQGS